MSIQARGDFTQANIIELLSHPAKCNSYSTQTLRHTNMHGASVTPPERNTGRNAVSETDDDTSVKTPIISSFLFSGNFEIPTLTNVGSSETGTSTELCAVFLGRHS